ncbi:MAG: spore maturation protein A [Oscillospiraceae bacterium]
MSRALLDSGNTAVTTVISLVGAMALWGGVMEIAKESGLTKKLCRLIRKPVKLLFFNLNENSKAFESVSMNIIANLLGLGNAATPLGLTAMKQLRYSDNPQANMAMLTVLNASSVQLVPITVASLRLSNGSESPWDFVPSVLIVSIIALLFGCVMTKLLYSMQRKKYEVS